MTFLGKLLVFLNAILATALVSWALSLYTNRVDWPTVEADGKKLTEWPTINARDAATNNSLYADARDSLRSAEVQLAARTKALADKLTEAKGGRFYELERVGFRPGQQLADRFDLSSTRETKIAKKDPKDGKDIEVPLRGLATLQKELQQTVEATLGTEELGQESGKKGLAAVRKQLVALDAEVARANASIIRYRVALAQREDEKRYLEDNRVNWDAQLITLQKRNDQLVERLKTLGVTRPNVLLAPSAPALAGSR
jgi:hypothetical protein